MTIVDYETHFYELARNATTILTTEYERVCYFIKEFSLLLFMST